MIVVVVGLLPVLRSQLRRNEALGCALGVPLLLREAAASASVVYDAVRPYMGRSDR